MNRLYTATCGGTGEPCCSTSLSDKARLTGLTPTHQQPPQAKTTAKEDQEAEDSRKWPPGTLPDPGQAGMLGGMTRMRRPHHHTNTLPDLPWARTHSTWLIHSFCHSFCHSFIGQGWQHQLATAADSTADAPAAAVVLQLQLAAKPC
jgi:hypothetical protein